jgi:hypothetical protein
VISSGPWVTEEGSVEWEVVEMGDVEWEVVDVE